MSSVSVCIVTYNSEEDIITCLNAVLAQSHIVDEIIVIDNASIDHSVERVSTLASTHPNITLIKNKLNNGFAGGQNQAISLAKGDYIVVLNPDVELDYNYVKLTVQALEKNHLAGSATGLLKLKSNPDVVDTTGLFMPFNRHAVDRGMGESIQSWQTAGEVFGVSGAAAVYKRKMIEAISLNGEFFDEYFFAYKEDVDVAWRARNLGWIALYEPTATATHARGWKKGGRKNISLFVRQHSYVNQIFMVIKNEQINLLFILRLPVLLLRELTKLMYIILKERDLLSSLNILRKSLPIMMKKRQVLQAMIRHLK